MMAKQLAHPAFGTGALDRVANGSGGSNHADARPFNGCRWRRSVHDNFGGTTVPPERKNATIVAPSPLACRAKIALPSQMLLGTETHETRTVRNVANPRLTLNDGQTLTAFAAAIGEYFTATNGGFAGAKTNFTGALEAMWAKCRLHGC